MEVTKKQIEEYRQLYKDDFDEELTDKEAGEIIRRLLMLYEILAKPLPQEGGQQHKASEEV